MLRLLILFTFFLSAMASFAQGVKMRDVFADMPDSILPLITKNNRLDCIDFIESNVPAQVKNLVDEPIELTVLTDRYLKLTMSKVSQAEMKLLRVNDTTQVVCMVRTYAGPIEDSQIEFYDLGWKPLDMSVNEPELEAYFPEVPQEEQTRRAEVVAMLRDLPLRTAHLSAEDEMITFQVQTSELMKKDREWAEKYAKPVKVKVG